MSEIEHTNADRVAPVVDKVKRGLAGLRDWAREHPDEACVAVAPLAAVAFSTRRHDLSFFEALVLTETGYWCGVLTLAAYRGWKDQPAPPPLFSRLKAVS